MVAGVAVVPDIADIVAEAAGAWGIPDLAAKVDVAFSRRLRSSAGRAVPARGTVRLHAALADGPPELLREVVIHELAHVAAHLLHGRTAAHGPEWRGLVRTAGGHVRVRLPPGTLPGGRRVRATWLHRCPVCEVARHAGRPVRNWRCRRCVDSGRSGVLTIERIHHE
jgi:predicted SprT family Zn-dependent metalloprotease